MSQTDLVVFVQCFVSAPSPKLFPADVFPFSKARASLHARVISTSNRRERTTKLASIVDQVLPSNQNVVA